MNQQEKTPRVLSMAIHRTFAAASRALWCVQNDMPVESLDAAVEAGRFGQPIPAEIADLPTLVAAFTRGQGMSQLDPMTLEPLDEGVRAVVRLADGFNGHTMLFFATPIAQDQNSVKLLCAEPGKEHMSAWRARETVEAALAAQAGEVKGFEKACSKSVKQELRELRAAFATIGNDGDADAALKKFSLEQFRRMPLGLVDSLADAYEAIGRLAEVEGVCTVTQGLASLPDGTSLNLRELLGQREVKQAGQ